MESRNFTRRTNPLLQAGFSPFDEISLVSPLSVGGPASSLREAADQCDPGFREINLSASGPEAVAENLSPARSPNIAPMDHGRLSLNAAYDDEDSVPNMTISSSTPGSSAPPQQSSTTSSTLTSGDDNDGVAGFGATTTATTSGLSSLFSTISSVLLPGAVSVSQQTHVPDQSSHLSLPSNVTSESGLRTQDSSSLRSHVSSYGSSGVSSTHRRSTSATIPSTLPAESCGGGIKSSCLQPYHREIKSSEAINPPVTSADTDSSSGDSRTSLPSFSVASLQGDSGTNNPASKDCPILLPATSSVLLPECQTTQSDAQDSAGLSRPPPTQLDISSDFPPKELVGTSLRRGTQRYRYAPLPGLSTGPNGAQSSSSIQPPVPTYPAGAHPSLTTGSLPPTSTLNFLQSSTVAVPPPTVGVLPPSTSPMHPFSSSAAAPPFTVAGPPLSTVGVLPISTASFPPPSVGVPPPSTAAIPPPLSVGVPPVSSVGFYSPSTVGAPLPSTVSVPPTFVGVPPPSNVSVPPPPSVGLSSLSMVVAPPPVGVPPTSVRVPPPSTVSVPPPISLGVPPPSSVGVPPPSSVPPPFVGVFPPSTQGVSQFSSEGTPMPSILASPPSTTSVIPAVVPPHPTASLISTVSHPPATVAPLPPTTSIISTVASPPVTVVLPPSIVAPPPVPVAPPLSTVAPPPATVAHPSAIVTPPPATVAPPPAIVAPPLATVAPPPPTVAPPPPTVAPPPPTVAPPPPTVAPPPVPVAPPSATVAPPSVPVAPPSATVAPPSVTVAPPLATVAPPPVPVAPPLVPVAPPPVPVAPPSATVAPPSVTVAPPPPTVAPPPVPVAPPSATVAPPPVTVAPPPATEPPLPLISSVAFSPSPVDSSYFSTGLSSLPSAGTHFTSSTSPSTSSSLMPPSILSPPPLLPPPPPLAPPPSSGTVSAPKPILFSQFEAGKSVPASTGEQNWSASSAFVPKSVGADVSLYFPPFDPGLSSPSSNLSIHSTTSKMESGVVPRADQQMLHVDPPSVHWFYVPHHATEIGVTGGGSATTATSVEESWHPFSKCDSAALEDALQRLQNDGEVEVLSVLGGRYQASVDRRVMTPVYWQTDPLSIRRCIWFSRGAHESRYVPYNEQQSQQLEEMYVRSVRAGEWHGSVSIGDDQGYVVMHSPTLFVHHPGVTSAWESVSLPDDPSRPRQVRRGWNSVEQASVPPDEAAKVNHLVFMVHGIGPCCDLRFRPVNECVDDMRRMSEQLVASHFSGAVRGGQLGRVEFMPVSWYDALHSADTGVDESLKPITLPSIPLLRQFVNGTVMDVLYYTSPVYCQVIIDTVTSNMNRVFDEFCRRHPDFDGSVSLVGHSLGSVILYDLLAHQKELTDCASDQQANVPADFHSPSGTAGTGQSSVVYPSLHFTPLCLFGLGSPIALFSRISGRAALGPDFRLPTCRRVFNIYHPYDPVAYRLEPLILPKMSSVCPVLIPHHKGRKRMHLEIKEQMTRVGFELKQRLFSSLQSTVSGLRWMAGGVNGALEANNGAGGDQTGDSAPCSIKVGSLNGGRRIDYVLQEKPFESLNEYVFAFQSHLCYWESEDTLLMILKEILTVNHIFCDTEDSQQSISRQESSASLTGSLPQCVPAAPAVTAYPDHNSPHNHNVVSSQLHSDCSQALSSNAVQSSATGNAPAPILPTATSASPLPTATSASTLPTATSAPPLPSVAPLLPGDANASCLFPAADTVQPPVPLLASSASAYSVTPSTGRSWSRRPHQILPAGPAVGMDPTMPATASKSLAPPPMSGFKRS